VKKPSDYLKYALILCIATAGNYFFNICIIKRYISFGHYKLNIVGHLKPVLILLASSIATELYLTLDSIMLEYFYGSANVAYYTNATKIVRTLYTVVIAVVATFYPRIAYHLQKGENDESNFLVNRAFKIIILLGVPCIIGLAGTAENIVLILFGSEYTPSINVLKMASILILVFSIAYILGHVILISVGKENAILRATIVGAIINAILNYILIPRLQQDGAIVASISAEIVVTAVLLVSSHKYYHLEFNKKYYGSIIIASVAMAVEIVIMTQLLEPVLSNAARFIIVVLISVVFYFGLLLIVKNEIVITSLKVVSKNVKRFCSSLNHGENG